MQIKKLFFGIPVVAGVFLTSCSADMPYLPENGEGVTFTAQLPDGFATRFGEGEAVNQLKYAVFHSSKPQTSIINSETEGAPQATREGDDFKLTLPMLPNETYTIVFWAQSSNSEAYSFNVNDGTVTVDYSKMAMNNDDHDVFFAGRTHRVGIDNTKITLTRPLAQINIGTDDLDAVEALKATHANTDVSITGVHNLLDLKTGIVSKTEDFNGQATFTTVKPLATEYPVAHPEKEKGKSYKYLAMGYVLTGAEKGETRATESLPDGALTTIDLTFNYKEEDRQSTLRSISNVPIRRNHRTNLHGSLVTSKSQWTITIDADFATGGDMNYKYVMPWDGKETKIPVIDENGTALVTTAAEFVGLATALNTGTLNEADVKSIKLEDDIDFGNNMFEGFQRQGVPEEDQEEDYPKTTTKVIFDGQGHSMRNIKIAMHNYGSGIFSNLANGSEIKNLIVENLNIDNSKLGNIVGGVVGYSFGTLFENVTVRNSKIYCRSKAGGIVGFCGSGGTTTFRNCVVDNVEFTGWQLMAGMVGLVNEDIKVVFENCPEPNVKFNVTCEIPVTISNNGDLYTRFANNKEPFTPPALNNDVFEFWQEPTGYYVMDSAKAIWYNFNYDDSKHPRYYHKYFYNGRDREGRILNFPVNAPIDWETFMASPETPSE